MEKSQQAPWEKPVDDGPSCMSSDPAKPPLTTTRHERKLATLDEDYVAIASLMGELDKQVTAFVPNMNKMIEAAPAYDSLATQWRETAATHRTDSVGCRSQPARDRSSAESRAPTEDDSLILGEEVEDPNDPLVFI